MDSSQRQTYFYLFPKGDDFEIRKMTDVEAEPYMTKAKDGWMSQRRAGAKRNS
jgi:hypothetical protein